MDVKDIESRLAELSENAKNSQIYFADYLISIYTSFRDNVYTPKSVLYPSCGFDASPARVFDNVTFVDIESGNEGCVGKLQESGLHALKQDIKTYVPKDTHDLLILLNPEIPTEWASRHLSSEGYVLANDYHGNATEMYQQPEHFFLWGVIDFVEKDRRKKDNTTTISRNLEDLFQPVKDAEELQRLRPNHFKYVQSAVNMFVKQKIVEVDENDSFEHKWAAFRKETGTGMPYRRNAERYIFVKK